MINDIIVIDDVIGKNYQDLIEQETVLNLDFPWYYAPSITKKTTARESIPEDSDGWGHSFWNLKKGGSHSKITDLILPIVYQATSHINFPIKEILWGRVFLTFPRNTDILQKSHNLLHVDDLVPHLVCLYYVNDSTGNTVISNATYEQYGQDEIHAVKPPIVKEVTPKKGRCVLFDGRYYHASTNPIAGRRCIINFDVI